MKAKAFIDGRHDRMAEQLTPSQWQMLFDVRSLKKLGLLARDEKTLTPAGVRICQVEWRNAEVSHDQNGEPIQ